MDSDSESTLDSIKDQHEALVQKVYESEHKISTISLIWKPAVLILIPLALTLVSIYLGFSWTWYFEVILHTLDFVYTGFHHNGDSDHNSSWLCLPDGIAVTREEFGSHSIWDTSQFLDINLGFGWFEFGVAKGIDIGWDLIVGRGGQLILALLSYRVSSAVLLHSMETCTASFHTYIAIGFDRGPLFSIQASLRDLWSGRTQGKGALFMIIFASLYLLAFPTFVSGLQSKGV